MLEFAGINVLCGVGILSTPYAAKEGGWIGLSILFIFGIISFYTGLLLRSCLDSEPGLETYPDIGQAAFGTTGRIAISVSLHTNLYSYFNSLKSVVSNLFSYDFSLFFVWMQIILYVELYVSYSEFCKKIYVIFIVIAISLPY